MLYVVKWTRPGESIYTDYFMAHNENDTRDKWNKLHISVSNSAYIVEIQSKVDDDEEISICNYYRQQDGRCIATRDCE